MAASKARRSEVLKWLEQFPLHLRTVPGLHDIVTGVARIDEINEIAIEDLLGRDPVIPRADLASHLVSRRTLMPEGLIDAYTPAQVADLFTYLLGLK